MSLTAHYQRTERLLKNRLPVQFPAPTAGTLFPIAVLTVYPKLVRVPIHRLERQERRALDLLRDAGLASERAALVRLSVNGSGDRLRLVIENPDDEWQQANFDADGLLYKAEAGGDWTYRGENWSAYDDVFDQETGDEDVIRKLLGDSVVSALEKLMGLVLTAIAVEMILAGLKRYFVGGL